MRPTLYPILHSIKNPIVQLTSLLSILRNTPELLTYNRTTDQTIIDSEGSKVLPPDVLPIAGSGVRFVCNLTTSLVTQTIPVAIGREYQLTIKGASGATAICSGALTGALNSDGINRISWANGTPKTATTAFLTITVSGVLTELQLEDVTDKVNQNPSESVSFQGGVGESLAINGTFDADTDWLKTNPDEVTIAQGFCKLTRSANQGYIKAAAGVPVSTAKVLISLDITVHSGRVRLLPRNLTDSGYSTLLQGSAYLSTSGNHKSVWDASSGGITPWITADLAGSDVDLDNIEVKEFLEEHHKYFYTENANTVGVAGVITEAVGTDLIGEVYYDYQPERINLHNNQGDETTTVITSSEYSVSTLGSGSLTLSGAGSGVVTEGSPITFTASSASLVCIESGDVEGVQVELGSVPSAFIPTNGAAITREEGILSVIPTTDHLDLASGAFVMTVEADEWYKASGTQNNLILLGTENPNTNQSLMRFRDSIGRLGAFDGTNHLEHDFGSGFPVDGKLNLISKWSNGKQRFGIHVFGTDHSTTVWGAEIAFDLLWTDPNGQLNFLYNSKVPLKLFDVRTYSGDFTTAQIESLL